MYLLSFNEHGHVPQSRRQTSWYGDPPRIGSRYPLAHPARNTSIHHGAFMQVIRHVIALCLAILQAMAAHRTNTEPDDNFRTCIRSRIGPDEASGH